MPPAGESVRREESSEYNGEKIRHAGACKPLVTHRTRSSRTEAICIHENRMPIKPSFMLCEKSNLLFPPASIDTSESTKRHYIGPAAQAGVFLYGMILISDYFWIGHEDREIT